MLAPGSWAWVSLVHIPPGLGCRWEERERPELCILVLRAGLLLTADLIKYVCVHFLMAFFFLILP